MVKWLKSAFWIIWIAIGALFLVVPLLIFFTGSTSGDLGGILAGTLISIAFFYIFLIWLAITLLILLIKWIIKKF